MQQIADNVFAITENLGSNNGMVVTSEGIVLIDAPQKPTDAVAWRRRVEEKGKVLYLINTDHHADHTMGNYFLPGTIIAHDETRRKLVEAAPTLDYLRKLLEEVDPKSLPLMENFAFRVPSITCNQRMTLHLGGTTFELMHFKGHTANGLMVYLPDQKILFSGDHVCSCGLPSFREACLFEWMDTLDYIQGMEVETIMPGHGDVAPKSIVSTFYRQYLELVGRIRDAIEKGVPRERCVEEIRYEDRVHTGTAAYPGRSEGHIAELQRQGIGNLYDQLVAREGQAP